MDGQHRATFASRYAQQRQPHKRGDGFRLMDFELLRRYVEPGHVPVQPGEHEFAVFDQSRRELAYFEWDVCLDSDRVQAAVEGHFGVTASRVFDRLWIV